MPDETSHKLSVGDGEQQRTIAVRVSLPENRDPEKPGVVWLGGFRSDMMGTKAETMVAWAAKNNIPSMRFDYSGHGESSGSFADGTISRWVEESLAVFEEFTSGPQIVIGSSMGGWVALRMASELARRGEPHRLAALLLIAPAPDFTSELMEPSFSNEQRHLLETQGWFEEPSEYSDEPNIITAGLIEDGKHNRVLTGLIETGCPVRILQGMQDPDVPYTHALRLIDHLANEDTVLTLVKDGDHRLSREQDLSLLGRTLDALTGI